MVKDAEMTDAAPAEAPAPAAAAPAAAAETRSKDRYYAMDETAIDEVRTRKVWTNDPAHFKRVAVSPAASMKMLMHAHSGCEAGVKAGGKPLEVMGMLLGYPDATREDTLVVTDVFPLPVTGFETQVVADDEGVVNYMIKLSDMLEVTRKERLMGWYHSHPFDVDEAHNHCFLSSTDLSTQLAWQNAEDNQGNPFLAIVVDPLRSFAKGTAEIGAFRAYPPAASPPANQCPDGQIVTDDAKRVEVWGSCWNRYYELEIEYYMSTQAQAIIDVLNKSHLWARTLSSTPALQPEHRERAGERVAAVADRLERVHGAAAASGARLGGGYGAFPAPDAALGGDKGVATKESPLVKAAEAAAGLATESLHGQLSQLAKRHLFNGDGCAACRGFAGITDAFLRAKAAKSAAAP